MDNYTFPYTGLGQKLDAKVILRSDDLTEQGEQPIVAQWTGKVDFYEAAKEQNSKSNPASSKSSHSSQVLINGDPFNLQASYVTGTITILGTEHRIKSFKRRRNPNGTVHHLLFEVE